MEERRCSTVTLRELKHLLLMNCVELLQRLQAVSYFCRLFILSTVSYFLPRTGIGGSRNLSHAQTLIGPSESSQLYSTTVAHTNAMKGQQKDSRQDWVQKQCWKTYCIVLLSSYHVCLDCVLSVIFDLTVSDWIVNSLPCTFSFHLKRIPVLYEVEFSDVY